MTKQYEHGLIAAHVCSERTHCVDAAVAIKYGQLPPLKLLCCLVRLLLAIQALKSIPTPRACHFQHSLGSILPHCGIAAAGNLHKQLLRMDNCEPRIEHIRMHVGSWVHLDNRMTSALHGAHQVSHTRFVQREVPPLTHTPLLRPTRMPMTRLRLWREARARAALMASNAGTPLRSGAANKVRSRGQLLLASR